MEYNFSEIEKKWQDWWIANEIYKVSNDSSKPKYYVLDMFPYPSGAGLHVGHPLGYIASDIYARYKRLKGFNVLHPMGYDAFGLPAEQYAIEHGIHPAVSTKQNIENFRRQLDKIGFCFDWSREVNTSDPSYYKWTQWIFLQLFKSFYNRQTKKAESINVLVASFEKNGNEYHPFPNSQFQLADVTHSSQLTAHGFQFTAEQWNAFSEKQQQDILMEYRLAYCGYGEVNWCEALGTVLANDEVVNGVSERGGYPVVKKKLRQWYLRITEYADRLLEGLQTVDFSEAMKEMQTNWIGKSYGAEIDFEIDDSDKKLRVFTTRPDTIFGVDFMVIAPEHELVEEITTHKHRQEVEDYITCVKSRSERERMAEKTISGAFTGAYAINPFDLRQVPIYISEYVLAGYGTGAIMAVPCGDERDFRFAKHFNIEITNILGNKFDGKEANPTKDAELENSNFLTGMLMRDAIKIIIKEIEDLGYGKAKVNYKMRDAAFSRQRYWGEPFPIVWKDGIAYPLDESELPLELPKVENYKPGPEGEGPLANVKEWMEVPASSLVDLTPNPSRMVGTSSPKERGASGATPGYMTNTPEQWKILAVYAKENRQNKTEAEDKLWQALRNRQINNCKFRRQHPVAGYIPDFVCLEKKLIVEIDGEYHNEEDQKKFDEARTEWLKEHQYKLIRFTNDEIIDDLRQVLQKISESLIAADDDTVIMAPSPLERAGGEVALRESSTMPGYAGSSWYFLRYMDPHNNETFCDKNASDYWNQVDVYVGGTEHAVGHLLYSRLWTKVLYDLGYISFDEPYKKLLNQGMIQGSSRFVYRDKKNTNLFVSFNKIKEHEVDSIHVDVNLVNGVELNMEAFRNSKPEYKDAVFICEDGSINAPLSFGELVPTIREGPGVRSNQKYLCGVETEKMSKSKFNTVDPSDLVDKYGADTFRMYEMFLGPVEQSKPWDTKGIEGVHRFLRKFWRLFYKEGATAPSPLERAGGEVVVTNDKATDAELKILHKAIKKIEEDTERFSYNTAVSAFMVCTNELAELKCHKKEILEPLVIMLSSYAPHIAEELYHALENEGSVLDAAYPTFNPKYLVESSKEYPISINGKLRTTLNISLEASENEVKELVLQNDVIQKWLEGKEPKKVIFVKNRMVNVVI
ncbi:leucine--tRNA ligase [Parafilimonas sp.]|uniref:leucine--tRNA ligase n=1 Tax=Parafilimonas sp. TaxID=1969739 RepID=UPI0039E25B2E